MPTGYDLQPAPIAMRWGAGEYSAKPLAGEQLLRSYPSDVRDQILRAARTNSSLLILGEQGMGKELLARVIHERSARRDGPFVVVDLTALPRASLESELFGRAADVSAGATSDRIGRLEAAQCGTVFIDHIAELTATAQAKLLRLLEKGTFTPWESSADRPLDVRLIAASNCALEPRVADRSFREDLYYRLSVFVVRLSPLRERREDLLPFVTHWLRELCRAARVPPLSVDVELLRWLENYAWPGNLRQLHSCLERMVMAARTPTLTLVDLPRELVEATFGGDSLPPTGKETLSELERTVALRTLQQCGGNRTHAAEVLGISVRTLQRRLKEWDYRDDVTRQ